MFVVMSDSHSERDVIENIKAKYKGKASAIFHCGDSELPGKDPIWSDIYVVAGNCDYDRAYEEERVEQVEGHSILITHGHCFDVGAGLSRYSYFAEQENAEIALFGHLHRPIVELINGVLYLNPGSVSQPRGQYNIKMYALVEIDDNYFQVSYRDLNHKKLEGLQFKIKR